MFIRQELAVKGAAWIQDDARQPVLISGFGGRRFLAKHIAYLLKRDLILIDVQTCKNSLTADAGEEHFRKN